MNIDRKWGPWSLRTWTLILNFLANGAGLYGLASYLEDGSGTLILGIGIVLTLLCIALLSTPARANKP